MQPKHVAVIFFTICIVLTNCLLVLLSENTMGMNHLKAKDPSFEAFYFKNTSLTNIRRRKFTSECDYFTYPINILLGLQSHVSY
jgi:hypothetical protein